MSLVEAKCTNCGAKLEVDNTKDAAICPSCNSPFIVEKAINNITNNITNENNITNSNVTIINNESISFDDGIFEGETKCGKPHGYGVCQYADGSKYVGNWLAGAKNGTGTITYDNGSTWEGEWKNNEPYTGKGVVFYDDKYYEGEYKEGKANGEGTIFYNNGKKWSGIFRKDAEWTGEGYIENSYLGKVYQTFEGKIVNGKYDDKGEWHCNGHFRIDGVAFDVTNDVLNYVLSSSSQAIVIPDGIRKVERGISGLNRVEKIICPTSLKSFNVEDISQIENLEEFEAPGIVKISDDMFRYLMSLRKVKFENATSVGEYAFSGCDNLEDVYIPKVKTLMQGAFRGCDLSERFEIPKVEKIDEDALASTSLRVLNAPKLKILCDEALSYSEQLVEINAPLLEEVGPNTFRDCISLQKILSNKVFDMSSISINGDNNTSNKQGGCYIATCVYGSYDCPQVWTLRRYRDNTLAATWYGRTFIRTYYAISPTIVKLFGETQWFKNMWQGKLDRMVAELQANGVEDTPYQDKDWR